MAASLLLFSLVGLAGCGAIVDNRADRREAAAKAAYPPEGDFVEVAGRRLHYVMEGRGPDLVLLHGAGGSTRDFTFSFVDRLKDRYRVIVFDRPGLGFSDRASDRYGGATNPEAESPSEQAILLQAAAAKLGAERPIVLGHSYGGAVALAWAVERPDNIAALVTVSGASHPWPGNLSPYYSLTASPIGGATVVPVLSAFAPKDFAERQLARIFAPQEPPEGYAEHVGIGLALRREVMRASARQVNTLRPHVVELSKRYDDIDIPVEIVHGLDDPVVGFDIHARRLAEDVPTAHMNALKGIGHMPHHAVPGKVAAAIDRAASRAGLR